ncbi:transcription initiation factor IIF subunit alpha [Histoplasma capsulatum G186AR]|uniref:Transcription initiation factor IIF subunit alpha n=2 Tax=Ajellomyces capsulatus TaxID=5037 RepID=C0NYY1_AJECG|nr:transcription initiation factor IIF subunit alpha [Histoplasma capsulatum G186AR]EEH03421.1 transcription initiation factor IIF subunit alpha [Histoplasma capsulatum G186AR]KAG5295833.1 transcription initiation factor IIF subunit alpha [Histoplasma capsulatum]QSS73815.1 transcription initiation factor IIF subunit alpha [Histoplasma capsulatum G186AR]
MSSTPPNRPPVTRPPPGPSGPPMKIRRLKVDPLVRPKKKRIPLSPGPGPGHPGAGPVANGRVGSPRPRPLQTAPRSQPSATQLKPAIPSADDLTVNGFSGPLLSKTYVDYPLVTTKRAWREGIKHHVAKFASKKNIDPRDESQFTRPVRLQRRDPRASNIGPASEKDDQPSRRHGELNEAEREELEAKKAAREKERADNLAQIAPSAAATQKKTNALKQRTQQVFKSEMNPEEIVKARIKYEEALPWHLDDFDNKGTWVGNYEAAMSETYAMFVLQNDGKMRMVPLDKWYKFTTKTPFKTLSIEEAEKFMAKKIQDPRWFMEKEQDRAQKKALEAYAKQSRLFTGRKEGHTRVSEGFEGDDLDFEEDRFADDEEHVGIFDEDEDAKTAEKRIKEDQLKANIFDLKDERMYDEEENQEKKEKEALRNFGKHVRKALQRREKNFDYSSGSDANPYSDESSDDSETEQLKEEKPEEERGKKEKGKESDKNSGISTKGTNTPSGRLKHTDPLGKKAASRAARKRPGSPNLSEASGTDTARKKPKNKHTDVQVESRPMSPGPSGQRKPNVAADQASKKRGRNGPPGSGSDGERGAGSGAEMSDSAAAGTKKLKLNPPGVLSKMGTPRGSRPGSPRANSPVPPTRTSSPGLTTPVSTNLAFPTALEIHSAIPATGIASAELLKIFRPRIGDSKENHRKFIAIVRDVSIYGKEDKLLRPGVLKEGTE